MLLEPPREDHLLELAIEASLGREQETLHRLLRDRGSALHDLAGREVGPRGAQDRAEIDPAVLEEGVVLARDEGEDHVLGDLVEAHQAAALVEEFADRPAVAVVDGAGQRRAIVVDAVEVGKIAHDRQIERDRSPGGPGDGEDHQAHERERDPPDPGPHR